MKLYYSHRYLYVSSIIIFVMIVGVFYFLLPKWQSCLATLEDEKTLQQEWQILQKKMLPVITAKNINLTKNNNRIILDVSKSEHEKIVAELFQLAQQSTVAIQTLKFVPVPTIKLSHATILQMDLLGDFRAISAFMIALTNRSSPVGIIDFSYKTLTEQQLQLTIKMLIFTEKITGFTPKLISGNSLFNNQVNAMTDPQNRQNQAETNGQSEQNPFCMTNYFKVLRNINDKNELRQVELKQIKMMGFIEQNMRKKTRLFHCRVR